MNRKTFLILISIFVVLIISVFFIQSALPAKAEIGRLPDNTGLRHDENLLQFISGLIRTVLGVVGAILLLLIIYGGFTYATAAGAEEKVKKGKNILTYAIIGIVIIAFAWILSDYVIGQFLGGGNKTPNSTNSSSSSGQTTGSTNTQNQAAPSQSTSGSSSGQGGLPPAGNDPNDPLDPAFINPPSSVGP